MPQVFALPEFKISRRSVLLGGGASVVLFPWACRPTFAQVAQTSGLHESATLLSIDVEIRGRGPFHFIIDTGADRTVLAEELAVTLELTKAANVVVQGIARSVVAPTVGVDDLRIGKFRIGHLDTPILPRAWIGADGYLGLDVLDGKRVVFDFKRMALTISEPRPEWLISRLPRNEAVARASGKGGRLRSVDCRVDGVSAVAFVDSGAEVSMGNSALLTRLAERGNTYVSPDRVILTGITGGSVSGRAAVVRRVKMGGLEISNCVLVIADLHIFQLWDLNEKPALFIGMDLLRKFGRITIDYGRKEYRFEFAKLAIAGVTWPARIHN